MSEKKYRQPVKWLLVMALIFTGCDGLNASLSGSPDLTRMASGVIEAKEITVSSEIGGKVKTVLVSQGDEVKEGQELFTLEQDTIRAQRKQAAAQLKTAQSNIMAAKATLSAAEAGLKAAESGVESAELSYQLTLQQARRKIVPSRVDDWSKDLPDLYNLPAWYFQKDERMAAAEREVEDAQSAYQTEQNTYRDLLQETGSDRIAQAESRLAEAQAAFAIAQSLMDYEAGYDSQNGIRDYRQTIFDAAQAELEAAQENYQQLLSETEASDILEGRARLSVAHERYQLALDRAQSYYDGEDALQVRQAQTAIEQAQAGLEEAQARLEQAKVGVDQAKNALRHAQSTLDLLDLKLEKHTIHSPVNGVVMTRNINQGEVIQPGSTTMTVGILDQLTVTVYVPEDEYGKISLGDQAMLRVDSFPEKEFTAEVIHIADEAEYTPRNVQTKEERQKTVFAIELSVDNGKEKLKPGMPTDVTFQTAD